MSNLVIVRGNPGVSQSYPYPYPTNPYPYQGSGGLTGQGLGFDGFTALVAGSAPVAGSVLVAGSSSTLRKQTKLWIIQKSDTNLVVNAGPVACSVGTSPVHRHRSCHCRGCTGIVAESFTSCSPALLLTHHNNALGCNATACCHAAHRLGLRANPGRTSVSQLMLSQLPSAV